MNFNTSIKINERSRIESIGLLDKIDFDDDDDDVEQTVINDNKKNYLLKKENEMIEIEGNDKYNEAN